MSKRLQKELSQCSKCLQISSIFVVYLLFLWKTQCTFLVLWSLLKHKLCFLHLVYSFCTIHQHSYFSYFWSICIETNQLHTNGCTDVPSACKQHKAAKFLQEIKELGYMSKGVHWWQNSCSRVFWTFTYHFPIPKHGVMAAVFHSCQRPNSFPNCCQTFGVRLRACACVM